MRHFTGNGSGSVILLIAATLAVSPRPAEGLASRFVRAEAAERVPGQYLVLLTDDTMAAESVPTYPRCDT